jgi:hypothetical protein
LGLSYVKETAVGSMEERDAKWHPDTHDPEFNVCRHEVTVCVAPLNSEPVNVKESDGAKRKWQSTDPEDGQSASGPQEDHASDEDSRPDSGKGNPPDAYAVHSQTGGCLAGCASCESHNHVEERDIVLDQAMAVVNEK